MKNCSHILPKWSPSFPSKIISKKLIKRDQIQSRDSFSNAKIETYFISLIHSSKCVAQIKQAHAQIIRQHLTSSSKITTQLISASSLHRSVGYSLQMFHSLKSPNAFIFNALVRGLADNSCFEKAVEFFKLMLRHDITPNELTFPFVLKSVGGLGAKWVGKMTHGGLVKIGFEFDSFVRVSLVDMYVKVELISCALQLFDESPEINKLQSVLLWNVAINGCCKNGMLGKAVELFDGMPERNLGSWNILIDGSMRNGHVEKALELFDRTMEKNVVSWTTMVHGFLQNGMHEKALSFFDKMVQDGNRPNDLTLVSAISACAKLGAVKAGIRIHNYILSNGFRLNAALGTALVDMYAKCGQIQFASQVFGETKVKDILTWTAMMWGWAIHGCADEALECFQSMKSTGIEPDEVVFLAILTACAHAGRVKEGLQYFDLMKLDYSIEPTIKHYAIIVDLYGRGGQLTEALRFIQDMPINPDFVIWGTLFSACRAHKNIDLAKYVSKKLLQLQPRHSGSYIFMSNIYAGLGRWEDAEKVRVSMRDKGANKDPGWSCIEVYDEVHKFIAGDRAHIDTQAIYSKLEEMVKYAREEGYTPETEWVLHNVEEEEKEDSLGCHSEKLALAFGLITTGPGLVLRIVKNLRICGDCHSFMKYVSRWSQREIVVRDIKRFHHFKDGLCSCQDYW